MVGRKPERDGADAYGDGKDVPDGCRGSRECCGRGVGRDAPDRLVEQISETLSRFGVRHGVIAGGRKALLAENVRVASIQTLSRCIDSLSFCPSVVVVDEAHHALAKTYRILWEKWPEALFLGLTLRLAG